MPNEQRVVHEGIAREGYEDSSTQEAPQEAKRVSSKTKAQCNQVRSQKSEDAYLVADSKVQVRMSAVSRSITVMIVQKCTPGYNWIGNSTICTS